MGMYVAVATQCETFLRDVSSALRGVIGTVGGEVDVEADLKIYQDSVVEEAVHAEVLSRAGRYLEPVLTNEFVKVAQSGSVEGLARRIALDAERREQETELALLLIDATSLNLDTRALTGDVNIEIERFFDLLPGTVRAVRSAYSVFVYGQSDEVEQSVHTMQPFSLRARPEETWLLEADIACAFTDYVQVLHSSPIAQNAAPEGSQITLGQSLYEFLTQEAGSDWALHYYTGSVVSSLISDLECRARESGVLALRGANEHGLACGAMARWQLTESPFLIVVTSAMIDEFKGTLANLREAQAKGFIVCAEAKPDEWFPFQGTITPDEDAREVLRARRIPCVYMSDPRRLAEYLKEAFALYYEDQGPVVLLATQAVLESSAPLERPVEVARPVRPQVQAEPAVLEAVLEFINNEKSTLLWQCGRLSEEERDLVYDLSRRAGIALVDSLARPGTVSKFHRGQRVENYLGTLGLYAFSARVYDFLHRDGRLKPKQEQCLFFLRSKLAQVATPFSQRALTHQLRIAQVTNKARHLAPFTDYSVVGDLRPFLEEVRSRLDVDPEVLAFRQRAIRTTKDSASDLVSELPLKPMSPNYFFNRLNRLIEELILSEDYSYTGVYDVGRGGVSAVRNLARTGPGFSGWYGRALMGDALQAVPTLSVSVDNNVLAFVGDGAKSLVPDVLPSLVEQLHHSGVELAHNISIFFLLNGGHSIINTYQEGRYARRGGRQMTLMNLLEPNYRRSHGPLVVNHQQIHTFDSQALREALLRPGELNLFSVVLSHNNEGDGLSLFSSLGWQRDELTELTFKMANLVRGTRR